MFTPAEVTKVKFLMAVNCRVVGNICLYLWIMKWNKRINLFFFLSECIIQTP